MKERIIQDYGAEWWVHYPPLQRWSYNHLNLSEGSFLKTPDYCGRRAILPTDNQNERIVICDGCNTKFIFKKKLILNEWY